jgi:hypothetical protein
MRTNGITEGNITEIGSGQARISMYCRNGITEACTVPLTMLPPASKVGDRVAWIEESKEKGRFERMAPYRRLRMPVMGPSENPIEVDRAFKEIMSLLKKKYNIQANPVLEKFPDWKTDRKKRNAIMKEAVRLLFQLESWESF